MAGGGSPGKGTASDTSGFWQIVWQIVGKSLANRWQISSKSLANLWHIAVANLRSRLMQVSGGRWGVARHRHRLRDIRLLANRWQIVGKSLANRWQISGKLLANLWHIAVANLGSRLMQVSGGRWGVARHRHRLRHIRLLANRWQISGKSLANLWQTVGKSLANLWHIAVANLRSRLMQVSGGRWGVARHRHRLRHIRLLANLW